MQLLPDWLLRWLSPKFRQLQREHTQLYDRIHGLELECERLSRELSESQNKLVEEKDKLINYVTALAKLPPVDNPREWMEHNRGMALKAYESVPASASTYASAKDIDPATLLSDLTQARDKALANVEDEVRKRWDKELEELNSVYKEL